MSGIVKDNYSDLFGNSKSKTMQVIIFNSKLRCIYRLHKIPADWNFRQVAKLLELEEPLNQYGAFRLADWEELPLDEYTFDGKILE